MFQSHLDLTYAAAIKEGYTIDAPKDAQLCFDDLICRMSPDTFTAIFLTWYPKNSGMVVSLLYEKLDNVGWTWCQFLSLPDELMLPYIARMRKWVRRSDRYSRKSGTIPVRIGSEKQSIVCDSFHPRQLGIWLSGTDWPAQDPVYLYPGSGHTSSFMSSDVPGEMAQEHERHNTMPHDPADWTN